MKYAPQWRGGRCVRRSPSWGAWIEIRPRRTVSMPCGGRRSPSWGAWIEMLAWPKYRCAESVAPPRGERGLKYIPKNYEGEKTMGRSPSWGAWIEILFPFCLLALRLSRSPSWGAWIEISCSATRLVRRISRSPSWGAWIEIALLSLLLLPSLVAPPRGERGLKLCP